MGLMARPRVLIADEPTTALDVTVQAQVLEVLRDINANEGTAIILISHNLGVINQLCDRVLVMYAGRGGRGGDARAAAGRPAHPYTQGLLASVPELPGTVPPGRRRRRAEHHPRPAAGARTRSVPGCPFAARCPLAISRCRRERPELTPTRRAASASPASCHRRATGEAVR